MVNAIFGDNFENRLERVNYESILSVYPYLVNNVGINGSYYDTTCFMMLLVNLAEPDWIQIDCHQKILPNVLCYLQKTSKEGKMNTNVTFVHERKACPKSQILKNNSCYLFVWLNGRDKKPMKQLCKNNNAYPIHLRNITFFQYLFDAVAVVFPPFMFLHSLEDYLYKFTYRKYVNIYVYSKEEILSNETAGLHICSSEIKLISTGDNVFHCKHGSSVLVIFICDGVVDCPFDNSDEMQSCDSFSNGQNGLRKFFNCGALFICH